MVEIPVGPIIIEQVFALLGSGEEFGSQGGHGAVLGADVGAHLDGQLVGLGDRLAVEDGGAEGACERVAGADGVGHFYLGSLLEGHLATGEDVGAIGKNTLLTLEIKLINTKFSHQHNLNKIVKGCQNLCIEYIRLIEKFLEQRIDHLYQTESTIIKVEKVKLFDFLISFKIFEPLFDVIVPDKNNIKKGSKIYFNCKKKNIIIENTVTKICIEPNKKKWYLNFVSKSDFFKSQEIMIYLISLSENLTFISITHHFKESTKLEEIQEIENKKKNLFVKIKQIFEDNQKDSLNEETTFTDKTDHNSESKSFDERLMKNYFENQSEKDYY